MSTHIASALVLIVMLSACASTQSIKFRPPPSEKYRQREIRTTPVIAIGKTGPHFTITDKNISRSYRKYIRYSDWRFRKSKEPQISKEEMKHRFSGRAGIMVGHFPNWDAVGAHVPKELFEQTSFPIYVKTFLWSETGDLVVAESNPDGVFVLKKVLCKEAPVKGRLGKISKTIPAECAKRYRRGLYAGDTGQRLAIATLEPIRNGDSIDLTSYELTERQEAD